MQQLMYAGPDALEWREAAEPRLSSDRAALLRPLAVATCDLDPLLHPGSSPFRPPLPARADMGGGCLGGGGPAPPRGPGPPRRRPLPALLRERPAVPARPHGKLRQRAVHVDLRLRSRRAEVGRVPVGCRMRSV